jgi:Fe-S cluster biogenesis protein NfuA
MKGLRRAGGGSPGVEQRIESVLHDLAPLLRIDHCKLQLAGFNSASGNLTIRIAGSCPDCLASPAMFATAIEAHVKQRVAEVSRVTIEG